MGGAAVGHGAGGAVVLGNEFTAFRARPWLKALCVPLATHHTCSACTSASGAPRLKATPPPQEGVWQGPAQAEAPIPPSGWGRGGAQAHTAPQRAPLSRRRIPTGRQRVQPPAATAAARLRGRKPRAGLRGRAERGEAAPPRRGRTGALPARAPPDGPGPCPGRVLPLAQARRRRGGKAVAGSQVSSRRGERRLE